MIVLSYKIGGLGGDPKRQEIYHLIKSQKPNLIMLQEAFSLGSKVIDFLSRFLPRSSFYVVDVMEHLGGLITTLNQNFVVTNLICSSLGILLEGSVKVINQPIKVFNYYGLYLDHKSFWEVVVEEGFLNMMDSF